MKRRLDIEVEINDQQRLIVEKVRKQYYGALDLAQFIRKGFHEWARSEMVDRRRTLARKPR